ncbi:MAG: prepilin peptidase [Minisyncoccia bacterium]
MFYFLTFIFGTIIGSFLNVVVDRADTKESPLKGRSLCPYCHKTLAWWEMVPVINYFYLKGRCSSCHHKLSIQYPLIEFLTGLFFALAYHQFINLPLINNHIFLSYNLENVFLVISLFFWFYWIFVLIAISLYDLKKYLIFNEVLFPAIIISFFWKVLEGIMINVKHLTILPQTNLLLGSHSYLFGEYSYFVSLFLGIFIGGGLIAALAYFTHEKAMGWGDVFVAVFMGIILGWPETLMALIIAFLTGGFVSLILMAFKKKTMKSYLPFAPFLAFGTLAILLFGDIIIKGYLSILLL